MATMWQWLVSLLLFVTAVGALTDGGVGLHPFRAVLADPARGALVRGPLSDRPPARLAAASRFARDARLPTPDGAALLPEAHRVPGLTPGIRLTASRPLATLSLSCRGSVARAPPCRSAPLV